MNSTKGNGSSKNNKLKKYLNIIAKINTTVEIELKKLSKEQKAKSPAHAGFWRVLT